MPSCAPFFATEDCHFQSGHWLFRSAAPRSVATCAAIFLWWSSALVTRSVIWMSVWSFSYSLYRSWYPKSPNVAMMSLVFPPAPLLPPLPQAASAAAIDRASAGASKPRRSRIEYTSGVTREVLGHGVSPDGWRQPAPSGWRLGWG